ncbi:MAG: transposase [Chitinophagaceae bacterium]|nr:transposase [Chitinophagaceae bacterium]
MGRGYLFFLTNITDLSPYEIAAIYKQRWDIEPFLSF